MDKYTYGFRMNWESFLELARRTVDKEYWWGDLYFMYHEDIYYYISTWDQHMDGRVFRDCTYDYGTIFGIAAESDSDLYTDYETVKQKVDVW